jgi:hypothetical protein
MNDFQEQAKNWLRNVVKQNPDKIKAGVEKAGDLIDKQTGGKYAEKVDAVQQKVGGFVDKQTGDDNGQGAAADTTAAATETAAATDEAVTTDDTKQATTAASGADGSTAPAPDGPGTPRADA